MNEDFDLFFLSLVSTSWTAIHFPPLLRLRFRRKLNALFVLLRRSSHCKPGIDRHIPRLTWKKIKKVAFSLQKSKTVSRTYFKSERKCWKKNRTFHRRNRSSSLSLGWQYLHANILNSASIEWYEGEEVTNNHGLVHRRKTQRKSMSFHRRRQIKVQKHQKFFSRRGKCGR